MATKMEVLVVIESFFNLYNMVIRYNFSLYLINLIIIFTSPQYHTPAHLHHRSLVVEGWWRWALVGLDGVAPSRMVSVSASVSLPLHHEVQKFSSGTGSPMWTQKKVRKMVVVWCGGSPQKRCKVLR